MIDGKNFFEQPLKSDVCVSKGQGDDYTTGCSPGYNYFKKYYKMIAKDLRKQPALDSDPKAIQQIDFTWNLENQSTIFFIIE